MGSVVAVFGISGVGKSWLARRLATLRGFRHVQAGELMRQAKEAYEGRLTTSEDLRTGRVLDNQTLLLRAFQDLRASETHPILFDGHSVIDTDRDLLTVPVEVIRGLGPDGLVFIQAIPEDIARRRAADISRKRPSRPVETLTMHQEIALSVCGHYQRTLSLPLHVVAAGDFESFDHAVQSVLAAGEH